MAGGLGQTLGILRAQAHLGVGAVDASLVALAERLGTDRVATLDHRHFRCLPVAGQPFTVLPADA